MKRRTLLITAAVGPFMPAIATVVNAQSPEASPVGGAVAEATPGQEVNMMLLPKFLGISVFDQANQGAQEAHAELQNPGKLDFVGPTADNSVAGQIDFVTNAPAGGYDVVMLSNNAGDQIDPAVAAAVEGGTQVVTWDSQRFQAAKGESLFVSQVDIDDDRQGHGAIWRVTFWAKMAASLPFFLLLRMPSNQNAVDRLTRRRVEEA